MAENSPAANSPSSNSPVVNSPYIFYLLQLNAITFQKHVNDFCKSITSIGNPFKDKCKELLTIDSRRCLDVSVAISVRQLEDKGTQQYQVLQCSCGSKCKNSRYHQKKLLPTAKKSATKNATKTR